VAARAPPPPWPAVPHAPPVPPRPARTQPTVPVYSRGAEAALAYPGLVTGDDGRPSNLQNPAAQRAAGSCEGGRRARGEDTFPARTAGPVTAAEAGSRRRRCGGTAT